jgi:hypothetical protein
MRYGDNSAALLNRNRHDDGRRENDGLHRITAAAA